MVAQYGAGTPDDWIERTVYSRYSRLGLTLMGVINLILWGPAGLVVLLVQIIWIPFWAAGVVNGIAHWWGYRNGETRDQSRNVIPWDFIVGGELLHNNHHLDPASARLSRKWWEFDLGWLVIRVLETVKLARVRR
jgi:stearoyl-CoA desaturase (delta-9 desaturase)